MWKKFANNPRGKAIGDCAVRAISAALGLSWYEAFDLLTAEAKRQADMPSADSVWGAVLRSNGFTRHALSNYCPNCYTAADFILDHPKGVYVLAFGGHVATVRNGVLLDSWDSLMETPIFYYKEG